MEVRKAACGDCEAALKALSQHLCICSLGNISSDDKQPAAGPDKPYLTCWLSQHLVQPPYSASWPCCTLAMLPLATLHDARQMINLSIPARMLVCSLNLCVVMTPAVAIH